LRRHLAQSSLFDDLASDAAKLTTTSTSI